MALKLSKSEILIFKALFNNSVNYLVIGGMAVQYYEHSRERNDIDIWLENSDSNLKYFISSIESVVGLIPKLTIEKLAKPDVHLPLHNIGYNFDILTTLNSVNVSFKEAYKTKEVFKYKKLTIPIINKQQLILSKLNTNNIKDVNDVKLLHANA